MRNIRIVSSVLLGMILLLVLLVPGCAPSREVPPAETPQKKEIVLVAQYAICEPMVVIRCGAEDAAEEYGVNFTFMGPEAMEISKVVSMLETNVARGVDGLIVEAQDPSSTVAVIQRAKEAGIPAIVTNDFSRYEVYDSWCGADSYELGRRCGAAMVESLKGESTWAKTVGYEAREVSGEFAFGIGAPGMLTLENRIKGMRDYMAQYPGVIDLGVWDVGADLSKSKGVWLDVLTAHPDLVGIMATGSPEIGGAALAVKSLGLEGKVVLVGVDVTLTVTGLIKENVISAALDQGLYEQGYYPVEALAKYLLHGTPIPEALPTPLGEVTLDNVAEVEGRLAGYLERK